MKRISPSPVGLDAMAGQRACVVESVDPDTGEGQVRLESGALWRATADTAIPAGTWVDVLAVVGTRLRVRSFSDGNGGGASGRSDPSAYSLVIPTSDPTSSKERTVPDSVVLFVAGLFHLT